MRRTSLPVPAPAILHGSLPGLWLSGRKCTVSVKGLGIISGKDKTVQYVANIGQPHLKMNNT